jgi:serine/threonine-protein kinase
MVAKGSEIVLVISKGKMIMVPDFSDYKKEQASAVAAELGLAVSITERYSSSSKDRLISQSIEAGSIYEDGDLLELTYSLGNKVVLASYVGQTRDALEAWAQGLNDQGARISIKATEAKSSQPRGTVIFQDKANTSVSYKTTINITVSAGKVAYVPDFTGPQDGNYNSAITREKAIAMCEEVGLIPTFVQDGNGGVLPGEIWSQSLAPGTEISEGTTITLMFKPVSTVTVPNFKGLTADQAKGYLNQLDIRFADGIGDGTVASQSLAANSTVAAGSVITLTMSGAPEESASPSVSPTSTTSPEPTATPTP